MNTNPSVATRLQPLTSSFAGSGRRRFGILCARWLACGLLAVSPVLAAKRTVEIASPATVAPGAEVQVSLRAATDAGAGEQIGFLHAEYSIDGGKTWTAFCYEKDVGPSVVRQTVVTAGSAGTSVRVRARVAFRGGAAGDVDYNGAAILWEGSWLDWAEPPARHREIKVTGR